MKSRIAITAVMTLSFLAAAASANASQWHAATYPATVTTEKNAGNTHSWTFGGTSVTCTGPQTHSKMESAASTLTFTVNFSSCLSGFLNTSFSFAKCDLEANLEGTVSGKYKTSLDVVCAGGWINFRFGTCSVNIPAQNGLSSATTENAPAEATYDVLLEANVTGMAYTVVEDGFLCPLSGTGEFTNGTYTGKYGFFGESGTGGTAIKIHATD